MNTRRLLTIIGTLVLLGLGGCVGLDYDGSHHTGGYGYSPWNDNSYQYSGYGDYHVYPDVYVPPPAPYYYGYGQPYYYPYPEGSVRHHHNDGDHDRDDHNHDHDGDHHQDGTQYSQPYGKSCHEGKC